MLQLRGLSPSPAAQLRDKTRRRQGAAAVWPFPAAVVSSLGGAVGEGTSISLAQQNPPGQMWITSGGTAEETGAPWPDGAGDLPVVLLVSKRAESNV